MEFTADTAKILASVLPPQSLATLRSTSKTLNQAFNSALSDDYTY